MADAYINSCVKIDHKYCTSRKKTNRADRINPMPMLNRSKERIGTSSSINFQVNVIPSMRQKIKNTTSTNPKLMSACTFFEKRNRYLGTFTFVKIAAFPMSEVMPWLVDSLKYEKIKLPQNR